MAILVVLKNSYVLESRKDLYDKNASEKGVDMVFLDRDTMIRISKNPGWYQALYKSYGRAPNARELYDIAHKKMKNEVYYNMDKNDAEGMAEKETMEAAKRRVESLERVKDIVDKFDDGDIVAQSLLEPETYEQVYKPTVETLSQGNAAVKKSSRDSALILSKMAENFHKNYGVPLKMAAVKIGEESGRENELMQSEFTEKLLEIDTANFMKQVKDAVNGNIKGNIITVMRTPLIMKLVGAKILPVTLAAGKLKKILIKHSESIDMNLLEQLPRAIANPMMIIDTYHGRNGETRKVFVLDLKDRNGATVVVPVQIDTKHGEYTVNEISSI